MSTIITLDIFSGRPNPKWVLSSEQEKELEERLDSAGEITAAAPGGITAGLGYRGLQIQRTENRESTGLNMYFSGGVFDPGPHAPNRIDPGQDLEKWLLETGTADMAPGLLEHVATSRERMAGFVAENLMLQSDDGCPACHAVDAPVYDPAYWNNPAHQRYNNCYNYANNQRTDTFAQPGRATGKPITSLTCDGVQPSAESDGLTPSSNFTDPLSQGKGWYVALVIWPGVDYHWYRQDKNGCWSHKPGQTAARNTDNSGNIITDPKTADRGGYTDFCTYMITNSKVTIR